MRKKCNDYHVIGIIGLAKNTGKTTTLNWMISKEKNKTIGVTSIGLDGEAVDQIHFLPKPRIFVHPNMIVATAKSCLVDVNFSYEILETLDMYTSIGEMTIIKVTSSGFVVVAGPTTNQNLSIVITKMKKYAHKILVDGAFNRMTFASIDVIEGIVIATGASVSPVMEKTIEQTEMVVELFSLPKMTFLMDKNNAIEIKTEKQVYSLKTKDLFNLKRILQEITEKIDHISVKGAVSERLVDVLIQSKKEKYKLIAEDPSRFLMDLKKYHHLKMLHIQLGVKKQVDLILMTVNPFRPTHTSYDPKIFMNALKEKIQIPMVDVFEEERKCKN